MYVNFYHKKTSPKTLTNTNANHCHKPRTQCSGQVSLMNRYVQCGLWCLWVNFYIIASTINACDHLFFADGLRNKFCLIYLLILFLYFAMLRSIDSTEQRMIDTSQEVGTIVMFYLKNRIRSQNSCFHIEHCLFFSNTAFCLAVAP